MFPLKIKLSRFLEYGLVAPGSAPRIPPRVPLGSARFVSVPAHRVPPGLAVLSRQCHRRRRRSSIRAPASPSGSPVQDFPRLGASLPRDDPRVCSPARLGRAPLLGRARGRGGGGSGARHVSEPAAALLRPAAQGRDRPAPPARPRLRPRPAGAVVPAGGRSRTRVPPAPGGCLGRGDAVCANR